MVVALFYEIQSPCNCFTLSLSGSHSCSSKSCRDDNDATMEIKVSKVGDNGDHDDASVMEIMSTR